MGKVSEQAAARSERDREKMEALVARDFPGLEDWQREVASAGGLGEWRAGMLPLSMTAEIDLPVFTLTSPYVPTSSAMPTLSERIELKGTNRQHLLVAALLYSREQS